MLAIVVATAGVGFLASPVVAIAAIVLAVAATATGYFVLTAPTFFAEVLPDGALSMGLYRRVRKLRRRHRLESAFKHTWLALAAVAGLFAPLGLAMADYSPGADSIGDVWNKMLGRGSQAAEEKSELTSGRWHGTIPVFAG